MKTKMIKKRARLSIKQSEIEKQARKNDINTFFIAAGSVFIVVIMLVVGIWLINPASRQLTKTSINETPKDINWFYNRSTELVFLKSRVDDIDNQTALFIKKHGTDETGYDLNEREKIHSLRSARLMLAIEFNELASDYNSHAANMNKSWNKTLPRQIYDIP